MSTVAVIPVGDVESANSSLESGGFGPRNFSIPSYTGAGVTHAALHCWNEGAFLSAVQAIPNVVMQAGEGDPIQRTKTLIEAQNAMWGEKSDQLPAAGTVSAGEMYQYDEADGRTTLWYVVQTFDRSVYGDHPSTYPALIRLAQNPYSVDEWRQPLDQYDSYKLSNPFTGQPDRCTHNGSEWYVTQADGAGNNTWEPGVFGWTQV